MAESSSAAPLPPIDPSAFRRLVEPIEGSEQQALSLKRIDAITQALRTLSSAMQAGSIANPALQDIKSTLNRAVEDAWGEHINKPFFYGRSDTTSAPLRDLYFSIQIMSAHDLIAARKKVDKALASGIGDEPAVRAMDEFLRETLPLAHALADMKTKAIKRTVKTEEERAAEDKFEPPLPSEKAAFAVYTALEEIMRRNFERLRSHLVTAYRSDLDRFIASDQSRVETIRAGTPRHKIKRTPMSYPVTHLVDYDQRTDGHTASTNAQAKIETLAQADAERMRDRFIAKNLRKVASIIEGKGVDGLQEVKILGDSVSLSGLTGTIRFSFSDDSRFTVKNAVVRSHSIHGTPFLRWPITFHDTQLAGNLPMTSPSEERMHTVFLGQQAPPSGTKSRRVQIEEELAQYGLKMEHSLSGLDGEGHAIVRIENNEPVDDPANELSPEMLALAEEWSRLEGVDPDDEIPLGYEPGPCM